MRYWRDKGTPVEKLNMGFATYGRTSLLSTQSSHIGAPISGPAAAGTYTREAGFWSYYEVKLSAIHLMKLCRGLIKPTGMMSLQSSHRTSIYWFKI